MDIKFEVTLRHMPWEKQKEYLQGVIRFIEEQEGFGNKCVLIVNQSDHVVEDQVMNERINAEQLASNLAYAIMNRKD